MARKYEVREFSQSDCILPSKGEIRTPVEYGNCLEGQINEILQEEFDYCPFHNCELVDIKFSTSCHYLDDREKVIITKDALVIFSYEELECSDLENCNYKKKL